MVAHRAKSFADAERWDLEFWQSVSPEERLSALVAIRRDVELVEAERVPTAKRATDIRSWRSQLSDGGEATCRVEPLTPAKLSG